MAVTLGGCAPGVNPDLAPAGNPNFAGVIATEEPRAAEVGRTIILNGGNAADAAAAMGIALTVTLPSRAGLNGGGMCMAVDPQRGRSEVINFAAINSTAHGLAALAARYGTASWAGVVAPAEALARFGFPVSKRLAADLDSQADLLLREPNALNLFLNSQRALMTTGETLRIPKLAERLAQLRDGLPDTPEVAPAWSPTTRTDLGAFVEHAPPRNDALAPATSGTTLVVGDRNGLLVTCVLGMGAIFGRGQFDPNHSSFIAMPNIGASGLRIVTDAIYGQPVLAVASIGPRAPEMLTAATRQWLMAQMPFADFRQIVQDSAATVGMSAAKCDQGIGVVGRTCQTISDANGFGLGLTFAQE